MNEEILIRLLKTNNETDLLIGLNLLFSRYDTEEKLIDFLKRNGRVLKDDLITHYNPITKYYICRKAINIGVYSHIAVLTDKYTLSIGNMGIIVSEKGKWNNNLTQIQIKL